MKYTKIKVPSKDCLEFLNRDENLTYHQISLLCGCSSALVYNWFKSYGIKGKNNQKIICHKHSPETIKVIAEKNRKWAVGDYTGKSKILNPEDFVNSRSPLRFKCQCGTEFERRFYYALKSKIGNVCKSCQSKLVSKKYKSPKYKDSFLSQTKKKYNRSSDEKDIFNLIHSKINCDHSVSIGRHNYDICIPEKKILIEYNGLAFHSEMLYFVFHRKSVALIKKYHEEKLLTARGHGYRLINVWEDDWTLNQLRTKNWLLSICGLAPSSRIYARKTKTKQISLIESEDIIDRNHIQGAGPSSLRYGLFYGNDLVSAMTFIRHDDHWNLSRYVVEYGYQVIGGFSKLLAFHRKTNPEKIVTFADLSWVDERSNVYLRNEFEVTYRLRPDYRYIESGKRRHKFAFRHKLLKGKLANYRDDLTEYDNCLKNGIFRIWDCGKVKYHLPGL